MALHQNLLKLLFTLSFLFYLHPGELSAQSIPLKYGKVGIKDLKMTEYDKDTSAAAIVLADYGHFDANTYNFTRHIRIKILKKSGTSWANGIVNTPAKNQIKGITYNLENGEVVKTKLESSSIHREKIYDGYFATRYFMPSVKKGSVIEISYTFIGMPFEWRFQQEIPVVWNELDLEPTLYVKFRKNFFGFQRFFLQEKNKWIVKDVPALKREPYMNSVSNYVTKFEFDLISIGFIEFANTWEDINKTLLEYTSFGREVKRGGSFLKKEAEEINANYSTEEEKIYAAFDFIKENIKWNERERLYPSGLLPEIFRTTKTGNSADINIALIVLLKRLDIRVYPLVLSSRENGILSPASPSINKLNYVIAYVKIGDKEYFLDATEKHAPPSVLPFRCLNGTTRLVDKKTAIPVDLRSIPKAKKTTLINLSMGEDGVFKGEIECNRYGYDALDFRKEYFGHSGKEAFTDNIKKSNQSIKFIESNINTNADNLFAPTKEKYSVEMSESADVFGNIIAFNPFFFQSLSENPFKNDDRKYPLDFGKQSTESYYINIDLPEDFIAESLPAPVSVSMPENSGKFLYNVTLSGNKLQVMYKLNINKEVFSSVEYTTLRNFYEMIVSKLSEQITVKKRT